MLSAGNVFGVLTSRNPVPQLDNARGTLDSLLPFLGYGLAFHFKLVINQALLVCEVLLSAHKGPLHRYFVSFVSVTDLVLLLSMLAVYLVHGTSEEVFFEEVLFFD